MSTFGNLWSGGKLSRIQKAVIGSFTTLAGRAQEVGGKSMRYLVVVEEGPSSFGAYVPDLPGCIVAGESKAEALALIREAIELHLSDLKSDGLPIPKPSSVSEVVEVEAATD